MDINFHTDAASAYERGQGDCGDVRERGSGESTRAGTAWGTCRLLAGCKEVPLEEGEVALAQERGFRREMRLLPPRTWRRGGEELNAGSPSCSMAALRAGLENM